MVPRNLVIALAGIGLLVAGIGCGAPKAAPVVDQGHRIDPAVLEGFKRGVSTRQEAVERLGKPTKTTTDPAEGTTTLSWHYLHVDAKGSTAIITVMKFGSDDRLLLKVVSQNSQTH